MVCRAGAGLRPAHFSYLESRPKTGLSWFEVITENYLDNYGRARDVLDIIRKDYELSIHGVSMNIASKDPLDYEYLTKVQDFTKIYQPFNVSDHLCWTGAHGHNSHELLPVPFTEEMLGHIVGRVSEVQEFLGRTISLENVSSYYTYKASEMTEWEFLNQIVNRTGCKILLDINNVYVSSINHNFNASEFLDRIHPKHVAQIHLAGFTDMGTHLYDTHSKPVHNAVWKLFSDYIARGPENPFMVEWDDDIPEFQTLESEINEAVRIWKSRFEISRDLTL